jgi:ABC-2 type transporter
LTPDSLHVALDSISHGEVHLGYDSTIDEQWRAMIILGLFPPVMAFFLASGQIQRDRRYGVLPLVVVATGNRVSVLIATRTVAVLFTTTFIFLIIASLSFLLSGLPSRLPSIPQTAGLMVCLLSATLGGLALSFGIRSERQTYFITAVLILPSVLFGGVVESLANAAPLSRLIGYSLPTAAFITVLREWASASVYPMNWLRLAAICWPPVCLGAVAIAVSAGSWRQRS